jgi:hypothetical protein
VTKATTRLNTVLALPPRQVATTWAECSVRILGQVQLARVGFALGLIGLLAWPLSYAWIPSAGHNPDWIRVVVPLAEWGAIACAVTAIVLGRNARRAGVTSIAATLAPRLGWLTLGLMAIAAFVVAPILYRQA